MKRGDTVLDSPLVHIVRFVGYLYAHSPDMAYVCRPNFFVKIMDERKTWDAPSCLFCITGVEIQR